MIVTALAASAVAASTVGGANGTPPLSQIRGIGVDGGTHAGILAASEGRASAYPLVTEVPMHGDPFPMSLWERAVPGSLERIETLLRDKRVTPAPQLHELRQEQSRPRRSSPGRYPPALLSTADAADYLGLKPQTLRAWRVEGGGPPYIRFGAKGRGRVAYKISDLEAWVNRRRWPHTSAETEG
jgi:hypothetical protein